MSEQPEGETAKNEAQTVTTVAAPKRQSSVSGILVRSEDFSSIELGDFGQAPLMPPGDKNPQLQYRPKSIKKIKFGDEVGHELEEVHYTDNLVYPIEEEPKPGCCTIL